jgi:tight adherence protein B
VVFTLVFIRSPLGISLSLVASYYAYRGPYVLQLRLRRAQDEQLLLQLPDALSAVANALKAGQTLPMAFKTVGSKFKRPIAAVFFTVSARHDSGEKFEDALRTVFTSLDIDAFEYTSRAITIHVQRGGPAYELLNEIRSMIIEQDRADRVIRATTASGRYTIKFLTWSPVFILPMMMFMQPDFLEILLGSIIGFLCLGMSAGIYFFSLNWAKSILTVEKI